MQRQELTELLNRLRQLPKETEWVEFKGSDHNPHEIGEYISALANSACLYDKEYGYLIFGVKDETHEIIGTKFKPKKTKKGNEELENWLLQLLSPRIDFVIEEFDDEGKAVVLFKISPAGNAPIKFDGETYIRVGSYKKKLKDFPAKERQIWNKQSAHSDWSAQVCEGATFDHLDPRAIGKARREYKIRRKENPNEVDGWDDKTFLNKAKVTIEGRITRAAILLLGRPESSHFLSPSPAQISWFLRDEHNNSKDYEHFGPPFILTVDEVLAKIRNLTVRFLPPNTLFPVETTQYDHSVIREALHNCIAHQDYELNARINVVERPDEVLFENAGSFMPGTVEAVIDQDAPPRKYRNPFLAQAMVNLRMIETEGGGIKEMFRIQRERFFPLPTYDIEDCSQVRVHIPGKIIDENYTRFLISKTDLDLRIVILLDKVQKGRVISKEDHASLKRQKLVEGRYPKLFVSSTIAAVAGEKAAYIKNRPFDKRYYKDLVLQFLDKYQEANRRDLEKLLLNKLPDMLNSKQRIDKVSNILQEMSRKDGVIKNIGSKKVPKWVRSKES